MAERIDYEGLLSRARTHLEGAQGALERTQAEYEAEQLRWAQDIERGRRVVSNAEQGVQHAERAPHVDTINNIRQRAMPLADELDEGLDNLKVRRALMALWDEGQQAARALNNGQGHWAMPFVQVDRAVSRFDLPPSKRPKSAPHALGLVDEEGVVSFLG